LGSFADLKEEAVCAAFENKFWGYWRVTQALVPRLPSDGAIAMVTVAAGRAALPGTSGLAAVNAAIAALAQVCLPSNLRHGELMSYRLA